MKKANNKKFVFLGFILIILLTACGGTGLSNASPASVVESYIQALVGKDSSTPSTLSCADWEESALMEFDSFLALEVKLDGLSCTEIGKDGEYILVNCQGRMNFSYNGEEEQNWDLSIRNYQVIDQNGEYLVCGYQ